MQVWCNDQYVGDLNVSPRIGEKFYRLQILKPFDFSVAASASVIPDLPACETVELKIINRRVYIADRDTFESRQNLRELLRHHLVPDNANSEYNPYQLATTYRWSVFLVSPVEYEQIFDLDSFQPI